MYIDTPQSVKNFAEKYMEGLPKSKIELLTGYVSAVILGQEKKVTLTGLGKTLFNIDKHKTTVSRFFRGKRYFSRDYYRTIALKILLEACIHFPPKARYILLLDGSCLKRGADAEIENCIKYRKKAHNVKGRSTKAHTFLLGLILMPNGVRIPAPRYTFYTKTYCKKYGKTHKTQHELAAEMIKEVRGMIGHDAELIVLADAFFDSKKLFDACANENASFLVPADKARVYIKGSQKRKLHKFGRSKFEESKTYRIKKGDETFTREYCRYSSPRGKKVDEYQAKSERMNVSKLGDTQVVFSWKKNNKVYRKNSFKTILCNNPAFSTREILELYALRWQIEIFFRELKSDLGFADFSGRNFKALERYLDLILMSYVFLEWYRHRKLIQAKNSIKRASIDKLRTRGLKRLLKEEADRAMRDYLLKKAAA